MEGYKRRRQGPLALEKRSEQFCKAISTRTSPFSPAFVNLGLGSVEAERDVEIAFRHQQPVGFLAPHE